MAPHQIESNLTDYRGELEAFTFELATPGPRFTPTNVIRSDQDWGVQIDWTMTGPLSVWLDANFHLRAYLERMGPGAEVIRPSAGPVVVHTKSVPLGSDPMGTAQRKYSAKIEIPHNGMPDSVADGVYRLVVTLQLIEAGSGNPTPVAGFYDAGLVNIFSPA